MSFSFLFAKIPTLLFFFFSSLGDQYATLYMTAADLSDSPQTLEKRRYKAKLVLNGAKEMCSTVLSKIFRCTDISVLSNLLHALKSLHKICAYYCKYVSHLDIEHSKFCETRYNPDHPPAFQMECFRVIAQLRDFCKDVLPFVEAIEIEEHMIKIQRIGHVLSHYLQHFVLAHPAFHTTPPPPFRRRNKNRSVWQY